jgi:hypothetical protein
LKNKSLIAGVIIVLLLLPLTFIYENKSAFASDQKLAHGAGTLPHLTRAFAFEWGFEFPTPLPLALRFDIGLGNRVQLGFSFGGFPFVVHSVEIHSMFNILKTARDSDFFSLYLNPGITQTLGGGFFF